jgi:hypothetical protein
VGQVEHPAGSNRGWLPDLVNQHFGSPLGSRWCANAAGYLRWWARLWVPSRDVGACDEWRDQAEAAGKWVSASALDLTNPAQAPTGSVVLYTSWKRLASGPYAGRWDAIHAGLLFEVPPSGRARPNLEGNGSARAFSANGGAVVLKDVDRPRVYGLVLP